MTCRSVWLVVIFILLVPSHLMSQDWQVRYGLPYRLDHEASYDADGWSITVKSKPKGSLYICCRPGQPQSLDIVFWDSDSKSIPLRLLRLARILPRGKPPRMKLGFTRKVKTEDGGFVLRHSVADPKYLGIRGLGDMHSHVCEGALLGLQHLYHSESASWRESERGKPNTLTTGDAARRAIDELLYRCGMSSRPAEPDWADPSASGASPPSKPLQKHWRVRSGTPYGHDPANSRSIVARGDPEGCIIIFCTRTPKVVLTLLPGSVWKGRMKLGFTRKVQTEDGGFVLRHSVKDSKYMGIGKIPLTNIPGRVFEGDFTGSLQPIYHSESVSLGNPKRPNTITTGDSARRAIDEMLDFCGIDPLAKSNWDWNRF